MMQFLQDLLGNRILWLSLLAWFLAQLLKVVFVLIFQRRIDFRRFFGAGGMPSSHSAIVTALAVGVGRAYGFGSPEFAICFVLATVVMYDAAGVRRAAGEQAKILNRIVILWNRNDPALIEKNLKELLGHTPFEVFAGALLGIIISLL